MHGYSMVDLPISTILLSIFFLNWKQAQQKVKQCSKKIRLRKGQKERQTPRLLSCNGRKWYPIYKVKFKKIISSSSVCKFTCTISYLCLRLLLFSSFPVCGSHGSLLITSESFEVAFDSILFGANTKWRQFSEVRHMIRTVSFTQWRARNGRKWYWNFHRKVPKDPRIAKFSKFEVEIINETIA